MSDVENQQPSAPSTPSAKPKGVSLCVLEMFFKQKCHPSDSELKRFLLGILNLTNSMFKEHFI